ncbi:MAG TPA: CBS domain-containing protein [candidate division Zixibacteria bacterium]|nr:CBS domain-containing protein [candidate division Zixibacteria bacterium]
MHSVKALSEKAAMHEALVGRVPLCVQDVMTRQVVTLRPEHTFADAVGLMGSNSFRHFPVVDSATRLAGVVSDRDILRALARTRDWKASYVSQFMSRDVVTVKPETELSLAAGKMLSKRINCLPVVNEDGTVCGIITSTDLLKVFRSLQEAVEKAAK